MNASDINLIWLPSDLSGTIVRKVIDSTAIALIAYYVRVCERACIRVCVCLFIGIFVYLFDCMVGG